MEVLKKVLEGEIQWLTALIEQERREGVLPVTPQVSLRILARQEIRTALKHVELAHHLKQEAIKEGK